ncbi:hypothetical protein U1Q18_002996 [Sarracenia purpurea var. burkii]
MASVLPLSSLSAAIDAGGCATVVGEALPFFSLSSKLCISHASLVQFPLGIWENEVKIVKDRDHRDGAQENEDRPENPEEERERGVEEPVADGVEREAFLEEVGDVVRRDGGAVVVLGTVDEEVDLVHEANGESVADEGEEEDEEERHVFQRYHKFPLGAVDGVVEGLLHAVRAADHRRQAAAEEDRRRRHQGGSHDRVPERLDGQDVLLVVVLPQPRTANTGSSREQSIIKLN